MGRWSYPKVEGVLYGLSQLPDARPAQAHTGPMVSHPSPGPQFPEIERRLNMAIAVERLAPQDREVLTAHYLRGAQVPKRVRRSAVKRLVILLGDLDS